jgi:predicted naringenin-chalcone synthase
MRKDMMENLYMNNVLLSPSPKLIAAFREQYEELTKFFSKESISEEVIRTFLANAVLRSQSSSDPVAVKTSSKRIDLSNAVPIDCSKMMRIDVTNAVPLDYSKAMRRGPSVVDRYLESTEKTSDELQVFDVGNLERGDPDK